MVGASVGEGARVLWEPQPGRHQLRLEWGDGESRQLEFVVKGGAALRKAVEEASTFLPCRSESGGGMAR